MAVSNAKQVFYLMIEFDQDFGQFPNDVTAAGDLDLEGYRGEFSNDYLAQFIAAGYTTSEEVFYAKGGSSAKHTPDNVITHRGDQLRAGECGFAYIKGLSTKSLSDTPILLTPMSGDGYQFKAGIHKGKAIVLRVDGAVKQLLINKEGYAKIGGGRTLFDAGLNSVWGEAGFDQKRLNYAK